MKIRRATVNDVSQILDLLWTFYRRHSLLDLGHAEFVNHVREERFVSLICETEGNVIAHVTVECSNSLAIYRGLIVLREYQGLGIAKSLFSEAEALAMKRGIKHAVVYSVMQHEAGQHVCPASYHPIGMLIGYTDIYGPQFEQFNRGSSNAEIVLVKALHQRWTKERIVCPEELCSQVKRWLSPIFIDPEFIISRDHTKDKGVCVGFHPSTHSGIGPLIFSTPPSDVNFKSMYASNTERSAFKEEINKAVTEIRQNAG